MNHNKKWMVTLTDDQYEWVKKTASDVKINGSRIIQELIKRTMGGRDGKFRELLVKSQAEIRRQELEAKKAAIEAELQKLGGD